MTTTSPSKAYSELLKAIVKAVPEIEDKYLVREVDEDSKICAWRMECREMTLEDVLRYLISCVDAKFHPQSPAQRDRAYQQATLRLLGKWHLGHSLEWHRDHAPETIQFLHSLSSSF